MAITRTNPGALTSNTTNATISFGNVVVASGGILYLFVAGKFGATARSTVSFTVGGNAVNILDYHPPALTADIQPCFTAWIELPSAGTYAVVWTTSTSGTNDRANCHMAFLTGTSGTPGVHTYNDGIAATASASLTAATDDVVMWSLSKGNTTGVTWGGDSTLIDNQTGGAFMSAMGHHDAVSSGTKTASLSWTGSTGRKIFGTVWSPRTAIPYTEDMETAEYTYTPFDIEYQKGVSREMETAVITVTAPDITRIIHVSARLATATYSAAFQTILLTYQHIRKMIPAVFVAKGSWHSPNPDWGVKRRQNRWWKKLVHWR